MALDISRQLLFVLGNKGLAIFDVSNPSEPTRLSKISTGVVTLPGDRGKGGGGGGGRVRLQDDIAFVVGGKGLATFDVRDPTAPTKLCSVATGVGTFESGAGITLFGDEAFVAGGKGVVVMDVSDPLDVRRKSSSVLKTGAATRVGNDSLVLAQSASVAYVGGGHGLAVLDLEARGSGYTPHHRDFTDLQQLRIN